MKLFRLLYITIPIIFISCGGSSGSEDTIDLYLGIFNVSDIKVKDGGICEYTLKSKDLVGLRDIRIECKCNKFEANQYLELNPIDSYDEVLQSPIYIIDTSGIKVTRIILGKDKDILINAYKNQNVLIDSLKYKDVIIETKDSLITAMEEISTKEDSLLGTLGIKFNTTIDTLDDGKTIEFNYTIVKDTVK